jgi:hypothetical protein
MMKTELDIFYASAVAVKGRGTRPRLELHVVVTTKAKYRESGF